MSTRSRLADVALVVVLAALMLTEHVVTASGTSEAPKLSLPTAAVVGMIVVSVVPLLGRRRRPLLVLVLSVASMFAVSWVSFTKNTIPFPSMLAGYAYALTVGRRRTLIAGVVIALIVVLIIGIHDPAALLSWDMVLNLGFVALPFVIASAVREREGRLAEATKRAEIAERTREEETQRRVGAERLRIARDVHDVVSHAIVAINVQAGVGARLGERDPARAREALTEIRAVSAEALRELRAVLGLLRTDDDGAALAPTIPERLDGLDELAERVRRAGVQVDLDVRLDGPVPSQVEAAAYRVIKESLTNVLRHAGSGRARVSVARVGGRLKVEVEDEGANGEVRVAASGRGTGQGVRGMSERVQALGGAFRAGPRPEGGWRVVATIPVTRVERVS